MNKSVLTINIMLLFSVSISYSQELDNDFLKTLPDEIQNDVLNRAEKQGETTDPVYRSIETQTELEKKELEDLKIRLEEDLKYLKNKLNENPDNFKKRDDLILFGSNFFRTYQSTYMPINEPNLNSEYILDFGDALEIQLIGQKEYIQTFLIKRDGSILMPDIGMINIAGLSLDQAISIIKTKVSSVYIGTEAFISLKNIKDVNVLVSGNAYKPGIYTLSGNSNILHALGVAGGVNDFGSLREINLIRNKKVIETLDMYDVLITGRYSSNTRLKNGDVIFVEPVKNIVTIDGAVKRPAKYELRDKQYLSDVLDYANGFSILADKSNIFLDRILDGQVKPIPISNAKQFNKIESKDGDKIFIRKFALRAVNIEGAVMKPGKYLMQEGDTLLNLLDKAGGYTENAYPFGAVYENQKALVTNKMAGDILYGEFIDNIITASQKNPSGGSDLSSIIELTETLKNTTPNGRIVVDINDVNSNVVINDGDRLVIPEIPSHIYIYGEVSYEGALKFENNHTVNDYIAKAGGLKLNADNEAIYVLHPNGDSQRTVLNKSLFQNSPDPELILYPGSIIFVPRGLDNSVTNRLAAQAYVSILGNIGIALASLSSINNN